MPPRLTAEQKEVIAVPCGNPACSGVIRGSRRAIEYRKEASGSGLIFCSRECSFHVSPGFGLGIKYGSQASRRKAPGPVRRRHCTEGQGCRRPGWYSDNRDGLSCEEHRPLMVARMEVWAAEMVEMLPEGYDSSKVPGEVDRGEDLLDTITKGKLIG